MRRRDVYILQMVIDGTSETVGSNRGIVERLLNVARRINKLDVVLSYPDDKMVRVQVPASPSYRGAPATNWIALYDNERVTEVNTGKNSGRGLRDRNVVRMLTPVGTWQGAEVDLTLSA